MSSLAELPTCAARNVGQNPLPVVEHVTISTMGRLSVPAMKSGSGHGPASARRASKPVRTRSTRSPNQTGRARMAPTEVKVANPSSLLRLDLSAWNQARWSAGRSARRPAFRTARLTFEQILKIVPTLALGAKWDVDSPAREAGTLPPPDSKSMRSSNQDTPTSPSATGAQQWLHQ